jgi:hypothetical protein
LRIFASLVSRFDISRLRKSSLCEPGLLASSCLIVALERLIDLTSLVSSIYDNTQVTESSSSPKWVKLAYRGVIAGVTGLVSAALCRV